MNWNTDHSDNIHNYSVIGKSFALAANVLMDNIIQNNKDKKRDYLIFPIFYDIDQAIEVYLKAIIYRTKELLE